MSEKEVALFVPLLRSLTKTIYDVPVPVIAAIEGVALGKLFVTTHTSIMGIYTM